MAYTEKQIKLVSLHARMEHGFCRNTVTTDKLIGYLMEVVQLMFDYLPETTEETNIFEAGREIKRERPWLF